MISHKKFQSLVAQQNHSGNLTTKIHIDSAGGGEENLNEFVLTSKTLNNEDYIFVLADNRLHIKTDLDFDCLWFLKGKLESIDGVEKTICIYYDKEEDLLSDLKEMLSWYNANS